MKKSRLIAVLIFVIIFVFTQTACNSSGNSELFNDETSLNVETVDFNLMLEQASAAHKKQQTETVAFDGFTDYLVSGSAYQNLLSESEIKALKNLDGSAKDEITYKEAKEDIELLFRTLKYAYGAYFYFGGDETFTQAEQQVMDYLNGKETINSEKLSSKIRDALSFVRDGHFGIEGDSVINDKANRFEYFYCDKYLSKDDEGFYVEVDDEKWYYDSSSNANIRIEPTLRADGDIVYSPILFCPSTEVSGSDSITFKSDSKTQSVTVKWQEQQSFSSNSKRTQDFVFGKHDGISYISIRCFDDELDQSVYKKYENTANDVKDSKLIIYDLRSNGGGSDKYSKHWVENYTGITPKLNGVFSNRITSILNDANVHFASGNEKFNYWRTEGNFIDNDIPIIVLVDDMCGSAGESALNFLKTMDNVIVIGSNSGGYQLCGNVDTYRLPNSGIYFNMPVSLQLTYNMENVDGIGYEPDIWCNPKDALGAVYSLIEKECFAGTDTVENLKTRVEEATAKTITLGWDENIIPESDGFGRLHYGDEVTVFCDGNNTSDYKVVFESSDAPEVIKNENGTFSLKSSKTAWYEFYIAVGKTKAPFRVEVAAYSPITLGWEEYSIQADESFGRLDYGDEITVFYNGEKTSDYKVVFEDSDAPEVIKNKNGTFSLKSSKAEWYEFYIEAENTKAQFRVECRAAE